MSVKPPIPRRRVPPPPETSIVLSKHVVEDQHCEGKLSIFITLKESNLFKIVTASWSRPLQPRSQTILDDVPHTVDLAKLLARRPPPPPLPRRSSNPPARNTLPPAVPPRRLSALQVPIQPPPINLTSKPVPLTINQDNVNYPERMPTPFGQLSLSCLQCRDFSRADAHAALFPRHMVRSLDGLARDLTAPFNNDFDKARVIYTWLHHNIVYDVDAFFSGNLEPATPESTLSSGAAVCEGYAGLFEHLADIIGLQCHKVSGHGKGYGIEPLSENDPIPPMTSNHAWNCVMLENAWHLIDACWGAGALNGTTWRIQLNPTWFTASAVEFGTKHFPEDPSFQLTPEETTWEEYITAAPGPVLTSDFVVFGLHPLRIEPATNKIPEKRFTKFSVSKRCEHMSTADVDNYVFILIAADGLKDFTPLVFNEQEGAWTATIFTPRNGNVMLSIVDTVNYKDAKGLGVAGLSKAKGKKAMSVKGIATWTIVHL